MSSTYKVLLAKPGLDGHDRGIKVIAMALRDAGAEVEYLGLRVPARDVARAAVEAHADVVGISLLSGAHVALTEQVLSELDRAGVRAPLVVGGTIPRGDAELLRAMGVADVFPVGTPLDEAVRRILRLASEAHAASRASEAHAVLR